LIFGVRHARDVQSEDEAGVPWRYVEADPMTPGPPQRTVRRRGVGGLKKRNEVFYVIAVV
jgi:hypothetical protein